MVGNDMDVRIEVEPQTFTQKCNEQRATAPPAKRLSLKQPSVFS